VFGLWKFLTTKPIQKLRIHLVVVLGDDIDAECQGSILQWINVDFLALFPSRNRLGDLLRDRAVLLSKPLPEVISFPVAADTDRPEI
jgi:hypothetical protein